LQKQGTDEAQNRLENIQELYNAVQQFEEDNQDPTLESFLATASHLLIWMTCKRSTPLAHDSARCQGARVPCGLFGVRAGLLPHSRTLNDPAALEEERRLCGITRAQERLYLTHARERRLWGSRTRYLFPVSEIPEELLTSKSLQVVFLAISNWVTKRSRGSHDAAERVSISESQNWTVGDRIVHKTFGVGEITHVLAQEIKSP